MVIATTNALSAAHAQAALARGLAVFCQKPLGRDRRDLGYAQAQAAVGLGHQQGQPAQFGELPPGCVVEAPAVRLQRAHALVAHVVVAQDREGAVAAVDRERTVLDGDAAAGLVGRVVCFSRVEVGERRGGRSENDLAAAASNRDNVVQRVRRWAAFPGGDGNAEHFILMRHAATP